MNSVKNKTATLGCGLSLGPILEFLDNNDPETLREFLACDKVEVDEADEDGWTGLLHAVSRGQSRAVTCLLEAGADPNKCDADNRSALHEAVTNNLTDILRLLLRAGADVEARDADSWSPLLVACYLGLRDCVQILLEAGAKPGVQGKQKCSGLAWASGRGHLDIVRLLLGHGVSVDTGDKYGTSPLIWAVRAGHLAIVTQLLEAGAKIDAVGMYAWNALVLAAKGNHEDVLHCLLQFSPNVNIVNQDGFTALAVACKEGNLRIVHQLISAGAHVNLQDKFGDTNLILASKAGHATIVDLLLRRYADVDTRGKENKTALYNAVEKEHVEVVRLLLAAKADVDITADGNSPLLRAVKNRNPEIVKLLLDKKAKLHHADKKGDTALHVAMRAGSKTIIETILRNLKNGPLLHKPNLKGETPYNIDLATARPILSQLFGARQLNTNETSAPENLLGYELYGAALGNILSEPSLNLPVTVGLYAKWGSGKGLLINKLMQELGSYSRQWVKPQVRLSPFIFFVILHVICFTGLGTWIISHFLKLDSNFILTPLVMIAIGVLSYLFIFLINSGAKDELKFIDRLNTVLARCLDMMELVCKIVFCHPPRRRKKADPGQQRIPLRHFFTDQTKVSTTTGGEDTVTLMIGTLLDSVENYHGRFVTRLYRALRPAKDVASTTITLRSFMGVPYVVIYILSLMLAIAEVSLIVLTVETNQRNIDDEFVKISGQMIFETFIHVMISFVSSILALIALMNVPTIIRIFISMFYSQRSYLHRSLSDSNIVKSEGQLQAIRIELKFLTEMVEALDSFTQGSSRLTLIVDGLDIVEQRKVLKVLDTVNNLFTEPESPFIILLAIDPHIIIKAIELNINEAFADTSVGGFAYLRNMVHLPFFLQNNGSRKIQLAQTLAVKTRELHSVDSEAKMRSHSRLSESSENMFSRISSFPHLSDRHAIPAEMNRMFLTDDYFSDVNPRSMRRLMNVIYVMGRLLKAFKIEFNWHQLSIWINITEQWPYRTSWVIHWVEQNEQSLELDTPLFNVYERIKKKVPRKIDPSFNDMDRDEKKLEIFLKLHKKTLTVRTINILYPFTINLDPYIKKIIREYQNQQDMFGFSPSDGKSKSAMTSAKNSPLEWMLNGQKANRNLSDGMKMTRSISMTRLQLVPEHFRDLDLSSLVVGQVCELISSIHGMMDQNKEAYSQTLIQQNINGKVLANCDLTELRQTMKMIFGDWELFKVVLTEMRELEAESKTSPHPCNIRSKKSDLINLTQNNSTLEQMVLEKEAMSGLVSGISEEARGDMEMVLEDRDNGGKQSERIYLEASGRHMSRSIPKLMVTTAEDAEPSSSLTVTTSRDKRSRERSLVRRQRSKSECPKEFDEKDEYDLSLPFPASGSNRNNSKF